MTKAEIDTTELPHNEHAERAVLGSIVWNPAVEFPVIKAMLSPEDFLSIKARTVYQAMLRLDAQGLPVGDIVLLGQDILERGERSLLGDMTYFSTLCDDCGSSVRAEHYARIVKKLSRKRRMIGTGKNISDAGFNPQLDVDNYANFAKTEIDEILSDGEIEARTMRETVGESYNFLEESDRNQKVVRTGIGRLDAIHGGLWPGLLTVLAARPSMGKSALAVNIALNAALANRNVLFFTLEDTARFVIYRMLSRLSGVNLERILQKNYSAAEYEEIQSKRIILEGLHINTIESSLSSEQVCSMAKAIHDRDGVDLVIIDHLGHLTDKGPLYEATTNACRNIARIPKELDCPVLLLHQLNRAVAGRENKEPVLTDLRQSGEVEQLARVVWMLHRDSYYDNNADQHEMSLLVRKNSHGQLGKTSLRCNFPTMFISDGEGDTY